MKNFIAKLLFLICLNTLTAGGLLASTILAGSISYTYANIAPNQYIVRLNMYNDCSGPLLPQSQVICFNSDSLMFSGNVTAALQPGYPQQVQLPAVLPNTGPTTCDGGTAFGVDLYIYEALVVLPAASNDWILSNSIEFFQGGMLITMPVRATLDNLNYPTNSSPSFSAYPIFLACLNTITYENFFCTDIDGDSLSYSLFSLDGDSGNCSTFLYPVVYTPPFSGSNPFQSAIPFSFDSLHNLSFQPAMSQLATYGVSVKEFSNGQLKDSIMRIETVTISSQCISAGTDENESNHISPNTYGTLTIFDYSGRLLTVITNSTVNFPERMNLSPGLYIFTFSNEGRVIKRGKINRILSLY